jgi:ubiquitin C-terminal hydrolase
MPSKKAITATKNSVSKKNVTAKIATNNNETIQVKNNSDTFIFTKIGMDNCGNTCYLNSLTQQLMHSPLFINFLQKLDSKITNEADKQNRISSQLLHLYETMKTAKTPIGSKEDQNNIFNLIRELANKKNDDLSVVKKYKEYGHGQQDIQETALAIFEDIENENFQINGENLDEILNFFNTFIVNTNSTSTCKTCGYMSSSIGFDTTAGTTFQILKDSDNQGFIDKINNINEELKKNNNVTEDMTKLQVLRNLNRVVGLKALKEGKFIDINNLIADYQTVEKGNSSFCVNCCSDKDRTKKIEFLKIPRLFMFLIKRFQNIEGDYSVKINDAVGNITQNIEVKDNNYQLLSTGISKGYGPNGGHYVALCKNLSNDEWSVFNDKGVTSIKVIDNELNDEYNYSDASPYFFIYEGLDQTKKIYNAVDLFISLFLKPSKRRLLIDAKCKKYFATQKTSFTNFKDSMNNTVLHIICNYSDDSTIATEYILEVVNFLIDTIGCNLNAKNSNGETPFMLASNSPFSPVFRMLLQKIPKDEINQKNTTQDPKSALEKITCLVGIKMGEFQEIIDRFNAAKPKNDYKKIVETGEIAINRFDDIKTFFDEPSLASAFSELKTNVADTTVLTKENETSLITYFATAFDFAKVPLESNLLQEETLTKRCKKIIEICKKQMSDGEWLTRIPEKYKNTSVIASAGVTTMVAPPGSSTCVILVKFNDTLDVESVNINPDADECDKALLFPDDFTTIVASQDYLFTIEYDPANPSVSTVTESKTKLPCDDTNNLKQKLDALFAA